MIPMVTCVDEMRQVKALIYEIKTDLRDEGYEFDDSLKVGAMIETPSAAVISDILAKECDFFSIGTNDLVAYTMSADRGNRRVAYLQSIMQPSVLRLIKKTIDSAGAAGIPVSICGEAGADPLSIPMFVGLGCDKFSVNPLSVPEVRRTLSEWSVEEAKAAAEKIMNLSVESEIREFVHKNSKGIFMP
jgi:phosphotransferase system enzyme I (PtsI)